MRVVAVLTALLLVAAVNAGGEDITLLNPAIDVPPPTVEELAAINALQARTPWEKVQPEDLDESATEDDETDDLETALPPAHEEEDDDDNVEEVVDGNMETVTEPKADLLDVSFDDLVPKIDNPHFAKLRENLDANRQQLVSMHQELCEADPNQCEARRMMNAEIVSDILTSQCFRRRRNIRGCSPRRLASRRSFRARSIRPFTRVISRRRCNTSKAGLRRCRRVRLCCSGRRGRRGSCGICKVGLRKLRSARRRYIRMQRHYTRLYIRYGLSLARYYRKKFKTLASVFLKTVHRVRAHIAKVQAKNNRLEVQIAKLKAADAEFSRRKASEHAAREKAMKQLAAKHSAHVAATAKTIADAKAGIAGNKAKQEELKKTIAATQAKLAATIAEREKHRAETDKTAAEARALGQRKAGLEKKLADLQAQLKDSNARVADLNNLVEGLKKQVALLQQAVDAARANGVRANAARNNIQTSYNDLLRRYRNAVDSHASNTNNNNNEITKLRDNLQELVERCVADACGVCGGDESTCANTNARSTCYSVGDPHFRTFDGWTYDFQYDGQFVLAQHAQNFEVQVLQRIASAPWQPRLNKGAAVRCGAEVIVFYEEWNLARALINGQSTNLPVGSWARIGDGCAALVQNANSAIVSYTFRGQTVTVTVGKGYWGFGNHLNLWVEAPWQWSSGRSMWGLCGDYDAWVGDDPTFVGRNWGRLFAVTNSARDLFRFPHRRTEMLLQVGNVGDKERERKLDQANGVVPAEELVEMNEGESATMRAQLAEAVFATTTTTAKAGGEISNRIDLKNTPQATIDKAKEHCGRVQKSPNSKILQQCVFDVLNGMRGTAWLFGMSNVKGNEVEVKRCFCVNDNKFALIGKGALKEESNKEGFSIAMWFRPTSDAIATEKHIIERGTTATVISQVGTSAKLSIGENSCTCPNAFAAGKWTSVITAVHRESGAKLFINQKECCKVDVTMDGESFNQFFSKDLVIGGASTGVADGCAAHVFYVPNVITEKLAKVHGDVAPNDCNA